MNATSLLAAAAPPHSAPVTDWPARIGWVVGLLLLIALVYWLMRQGWKWRGALQGDLPPLPAAPAGAEDEPVLLHCTGRYHGSTAEGRWLERIVAHGLGVRSRAELTLTRSGLDVTRTGAPDFFIPAAALRGARPERALAGKVLPEGGLLAVTWEHGSRRIDSGFRADRAAEHPDWVAALTELASTAGAEQQPVRTTEKGTAP